MPPQYRSDVVDLYHGDCRDVLASLQDNSVDLILTDPPYYRVKDEAWDRQWKTVAEYLRWLDSVLEQFARVLRSNGSLYLFADAGMASNIECLIAQRFNVLNRITWQKERDRGKHAAACKETLRSFFPNSEAIIFAEHRGADNIAKGEAGYEAKCDELRGFLFEPLRKYLDDERERSGLSVRTVAEAFQRKTGSRTITGMAGHWFGSVQWALPTIENYQWLRVLLGDSYLQRSYDDLRRQYDDLRRQYDDLRRPFSVSKDVPYTDVWDFPTVAHYAGKHPCEKPQVLLHHVVAASSRFGAVVLDAFFGSGAVGEAATSLGRRCIAIEMSEHWCDYAAKRLHLEKVTTEQ